jgi:hypothetical protein
VLRLKLNFSFGWLRIILSQPINWDILKVWQLLLTARVAQVTSSLFYTAYVIVPLPMKFGSALDLPIPLPFVTNMGVMAWIRETTFTKWILVSFLALVDMDMVMWFFKYGFAFKGHSVENEP